MGPFIALVVTIVVISAVVGVIAQFLNKLNEANTPPPRRGGANGPRRQSTPARGTDPEMERFLAEIDRLRRKNTDTASAHEERAERPKPPAARPVARPAAAVPVARPAGKRSSDRQRARATAELAEPKPRRSESPRSAPTAPPLFPITIEELPVAVSPPRAPETPIARLAPREQHQPATPFARDLGALLASGQGPALAIVLQEILGPPKCKRRR